MDKKMNCHIIRQIAVIDTKESSWQLELNEISWDGKGPKLDIRRWNATHDRCSKGIRLTAAEARGLLGALQKEVME